MAISKIQYTVTDGNLFKAIAGEDHVSAILFDVTTTPDGGGTIPTDGEVHQIFSIDQAEALGIDGIIDPEAPTGSEYEGGVVHKHIQDFFTVNPNGELWIGLADCSSDFSHLTNIQNVAQGRVRQIGVYTEQEVFVDGAPYTLNGYISAINTIAEADAENNIPYSVVISGNTATVSNGGTDVDITQIPTAISNLKRVSLTLGQSNDALTKAIQDNDTTKATVGIVGSVIGAISLAAVHESIGWTGKFNLSASIPTIAFGFGGVIADIDNNTPYESLDINQLNTFDNNGYIFPLRYPDLAGTYFSSNQTLTSGDYRTIARNRAIDKSRRNVRLALLPTIQQPLYVNPENGNVSVGTIGQFTSIVDTQLSALTSLAEISGYSININPKQDVLANDGISIQYRIIPVGENKNIDVEIGFSRTV